jgi:plastocyanin
MKSLLVLWSVFFFLSNSYGKEHMVVIESMKFEPKELTVKKGDTITWINKDFFPHTATSLKNFNSKGIPAGKSWSYKAMTPGNFQYKCLFHPPMKGTLIVE